MTLAQSGHNNQKGSENINYVIVEYWEMFQRDTNTSCSDEI